MTSQGILTSSGFLPEGAAIPTYSYIGQDFGSSNHCSESEALDSKPAALCEPALLFWQLRLWFRKLSDRGRAHVRPQCSQVCGLSPSCSRFLWRQRLALTLLRLPVTVFGHASHVRSI